MALWTPYEPDQALDLSKASKLMKLKEDFNYSPVGENQTRHFQLSPKLYSHPHSSYQGLSLSPPQRVPGYYEAKQPLVSPDSDRGRTRKTPRPFKAVTAALPELEASSDPDLQYAAFRAAMLDAMRARNGGSLTVSNPRMRRSVHRSSDVEDGEYLERRARNNAAAKRSRDLRKQKEDELAIRAAFLEHANADLRARVAASRCRRCGGVLL